MTSAPSFAVVIPTVGRAELRTLLADLRKGAGPHATQIVVVDDRRAPMGDLDLRPDLPVRVHRSGGRGPAAARNAGWRATDAEWVVFLDDDVRLPAGWWTSLASDLLLAPPDVGAVQGRLVVPQPPDRRATDWERNVAGLESARWATADIAYRRRALDRVGGFDERFPRAYREDADLAARVRRAGFALVRGQRTTVHPVRPTGPSVSVRKQSGNADDALLRQRYGRRWRTVVDTPPGRMARHAATTGALVVAMTAAVGRRRALAAVASGAWVAAVAAFAASRIRPGPRTPREVVTMAVTSALIPPVAAGWRIGGEIGVRAAARRGLRPDAVVPGSPRAVAAVLFDRDGTLVVDVPYNGDPRRVRPVPGARAALARLRGAGVLLGIITNQSGIARQLLTEADVDAVNRRVGELLGPFDVVLHCPHDPAEACDCRKPASGMVRRAAELLAVPANACVVVGDTGADVDAAVGAGAVGVLVPNSATRADEIARAPFVAADIGQAVEIVLDL